MAKKARLDAKATAIGWRAAPGHRIIVQPGEQLYVVIHVPDGTVAPLELEAVHLEIAGKARIVFQRQNVSVALHHLVTMHKDH